MINGPDLWITAATDNEWGKNTRLADKKALLVNAPSQDAVTHIKKTNC